MPVKILMVVLPLMARVGFSQGFVNLNFESAITTNHVFSDISASDAFPSWTATAIFLSYNDFALSGSSLSIMDTNALYTPSQVEGNYYALLFGSTTARATNPISLSQTGLVPVTAKSILFWGDDQGMVITFNGAPLNFTAMSSTANYTVYGADVSTYAGQVGLLSFSAGYGVQGIVDNIQFSSTAVPEPNSLALAALGAAMFGWCRWRSFTRAAA